jgi:crossover junction endodeoxyribonuclease RusA
MVEAVIEVLLPYPVSTNVYYRSIVLRGRPVTLVSKEARVYKQTAGWMAREAGIRAPISGWVTLDLTLHPIEPQDVSARVRKIGPGWHMFVRCIDLDNALKVSLDALQGVAYADDAQIVDIRIRRGLPIPGGGLTVRIDVPDIADVEQSPQAALPIAAEDPFHVEHA